MAQGVLSGAVKLFIVLHLFFTFSTCSPLVGYESRNALENGPENEKRQSGFFPVLGVPGEGDTTVDLRLEIRQLEKKPDQWNLYLLALRKFQNMTQSDKLSYYQIAGIHGRPYIAWDNVRQGNGGSGGYCTHGSNIFPTWHRPYLALFEQALYDNAQSVVNEFSGSLKTRYTTALATFRMPYWDWAAIPPSGQSTLPNSLQQPNVLVTTPTGNITIPNPLFSYRFHPLSASDMGNAQPFSTWPQTLRAPSSSTSSTATSRNNLVASQLDANRPNLQSRIYNVLAMQHNYNNVSNDRRPGDSFESTHDTVHNLVGQNGHMSIIAYSAFDPIFWLHHTNVDRYLAIWQAINPNSYVTAATNPGSTFTIQAGSVADTNTGLTPFHKDSSGAFWTSEQVRSTRIFGYTYPEIAGTSATSLASKVNALYGPNASAPKKRSLDDSEGQLVERAPRHRDTAGAPNFSGQRQYMANILVNKFGLDSSFNINIFLGDNPGDDPTQWATDPSFVGLTGIFATVSNDMSNAVDADSTVNGVVELTAALEASVRNGDLASMRERDVAPYLQTNLQWKVSKVSGEAIAAEDTPGLEVSVLWAQIKPAANEDEFPQVMGDYQVLPDATEGAGGV